MVEADSGVHRLGSRPRPRPLAQAQAAAKRPTPPGAEKPAAAMPSQPTYDLVFIPEQIEPVDSNGQAINRQLARIATAAQALMFTLPQKEEIIAAVRDEASPEALEDNLKALANILEGLQGQFRVYNFLHQVISLNQASTKIDKLIFAYVAKQFYGWTGQRIVDTLRMAGNRFRLEVQQNEQGKYLVLTNQTTQAIQALAFSTTPAQLTGILR